LVRRAHRPAQYLPRLPTASVPSMPHLSPRRHKPPHILIRSLYSRSSQSSSSSVTVPNFPQGHQNQAAPLPMVASTARHHPSGNTIWEGPQQLVAAPMPPPAATYGLPTLAWDGTSECPGIPADGLQRGNGTSESHSQRWDVDTPVMSLPGLGPATSAYWSRKRYAFSLDLTLLALEFGFVNSDLGAHAGPAVIKPYDTGDTSHRPIDPFATCGSLVGVAGVVTEFTGAEADEPDW